MRSVRELILLSQFQVQACLNLLVLKGLQYSALCRWSDMGRWLSWAQARISTIDSCQPILERGGAELLSFGGQRQTLD